jgi:hypothetical protein
MKQKKKLQIAQACHNAHNVICKNAGMHVIPWEEKSPEHQATVADSLDKILSGAIRTPQEAHFNFVMQKREDGWEFYQQYSTRNKTNPRLCDWDETEQMKEEMFFAVVSSFKKS